MFSLVDKTKYLFEGEICSPDGKILKPLKGVCGLVWSMTFLCLSKLLASLYSLAKIIVIY